MTRLLERKKIKRKPKQLSDGTKKTTTRKPRAKKTEAAVDDNAAQAKEVKKTKTTKTTKAVKTTKAAKKEKTDADKKAEE